MNWFIKAFKNYANFKGRSQRAEYWYFILVYFILSILVGFVDLLLFQVLPLATVQILGNLLALILFIPSISVAARRLHDTGRSGWWQLIILIPIIGFLVLIYFLVQDSDISANEYGENPKEEFLVNQGNDINNC